MTSESLTGESCDIYIFKKKKKDWEKTEEIHQKQTKKKKPTHFSVNRKNIPMLKIESSWFLILKKINLK